MRENPVRTEDRECRSATGSALIMALFALVLLSGMGTALLFLSRNEAKMSQTNLRLRKAFYLAESGIEDGRTTLFLTNGSGSFDDDLVAAAGVDNLISLDPDNLQAVYDSAGNVTGFTGFGDDIPLRSWTSLATPGNPGWYSAFLTNDPIEAANPDPLDDMNDRVMITSIGAGDNRSLSVVQAIVRPYQLLPNVPAAAIAMLGPQPVFDNGPSAVQSHSGDDCGVPGGAYAPIVGTVGSSANAQVQADMNHPENFSSGPLPFTGTDTIGDMTDPLDPIVDASGHGTIDPVWLNCQELKQMMLTLALNADYYCDTDTTSCTLPSTSPGAVVFIDGDLTNTPAGSFTGILAITGKLTLKGNTGWDGVVIAIGEGSILRNGGGGGNPSGAVVIANIDPTPDGPNADKSDWCSTPPDGFDQASYNTTGGGNSKVQWCTGSINSANTIRSYRVTEFLQR